MEYVVKHKRLKEFLYLLGFRYREVKDKTGKQDVVYLFQKTDLLLESITFYTKQRREILGFKK